MNECNQKKRREQGGKSEGGKQKLPAGFEQVNLHAAGIDIGSGTHYAAVPEASDSEPVRNFGCTTPDLHDMAKWLKSCGIDTVAMESTGVYWIPVVQVLEQYGFDIVLVNARHVKNVPGRKSDVQDCQWLQQLHTFGLLRGAFLPEKNVSILRNYWRHRASLVELSARQIQIMQKSMVQMNIQLHKAISDISGLSGMRIIRAIVAGERDAEVLADMRDFRIRSGKEEMVKALTGNYREDHLFTLKQAVELYDYYHEKITECDRQIEKIMGAFDPKGNPEDLSAPKAKSGKNNAPRFDLRGELYKITGVDLTRIHGINSMTAHTVITECGFDMSSFPTEKNFVSYLCLCPNNRITGGKVFSSRTRKSYNRATTALRMAAQSLHSSQSALGAFYRRMRMSLGAPKAITATARKLAIRIYHMLKYGEEYVDAGQEQYERKNEERMLKNIKIRAKSMGFGLVALDTGEVVS